VSSFLAQNWEDRANRCTQVWNLTDLNWHSGMSTARIAFCESSFGPAVLKLSNYPGAIEIERRALMHFGAEACPRVLGMLAADEAILLERIEVDHDLSAVYPSVEKEIDIWLPFFQAVIDNPEVPDGFPSLADYAKVFDMALGRTTRDDVANVMRYARNNREILMASPNEHRLLHGDLHHFNLLCDQKGNWRMIDPHGVIGNPLYEIGAYMRNPMSAFYREPGVQERVAERLSCLAERLALETEVVARYAFYGTAFSIAWDFEDGQFDVDPKLIELAVSLMALGGNR